MMVRSLLLIPLMAFCNTQNLIKGGKTSQTSYYTAGTVKYTSERAIDGNMTHCAHSKRKEKSWWNIDLLSLYEISNITIYNVDSGNVDLTGAEIRIGNLSETHGTANSMCTSITVNTRGVNTTFNCSQGPMVGRYVTVYLQKNWFLILCEVWIYGTNVSPFLLINENKTWEDALNYCRAQNMDLASIFDNQTQTWAELEVMKASSSFVWLGLRYTCTLEFWFSVGDHPFTYEHWAAGQPTENCDMSVAIETTGDYKWYSKSDNEKFNFICVI